MSNFILTRADKSQYGEWEGKYRLEEIGVSSWKAGK